MNEGSMSPRHEPASELKAELRAAGLATTREREAAAPPVRMSNLPTNHKRKMERQMSPLFQPKSQCGSSASNTQAYPRVLFPSNNKPWLPAWYNTSSSNTSSQASSPLRRERPAGALDVSPAATTREAFPLSHYYPYPFTHERERGPDSPLRSFKDKSRERRNNSCRGKQQQQQQQSGGDNPSTSRERRNGNDAGIGKGSHHRAKGPSSHGGEQEGKQALRNAAGVEEEGKEIHMRPLLLPKESITYGNAKNKNTLISPPPLPLSRLDARVPLDATVLKRNKHGNPPRSKYKAHVSKAKMNVGTGMKACGAGGMNVGAENGERRDDGLHRKRKVAKKSGAQSSRECARKEDEKGNRGDDKIYSSAILASNALEVTLTVSKLDRGQQGDNQDRDGRDKREMKEDKGVKLRMGGEKEMKRTFEHTPNALTVTRGLELDRGQQGDKQDHDGRDKREKKEDKGVKLRMRGEKEMKRTFEQTPNALKVTRGLELDSGQQGDKQDRDRLKMREMEHEKHEKLRVAWEKEMKRNFALSPNEIQVTGGLELDKAQQGDKQDRDGREKREMKDDMNEKLRLQGEKEMKKKEDELEKNKDKNTQVEDTNTHEKVDIINNKSDKREVDVDEVGKEEKMERKREEQENEEKEGGEEETQEEGEKLRVLMWLGYNAVIKQREQEVKELAKIKRDKLQKNENAHSVLMWLGEQIVEARRRKASAKMMATKFMFGQKKEAPSVMTSFRQCATNMAGDCVAM